MNRRLLALVSTAVIACWLLAPARFAWGQQADGPPADAPAGPSVGSDSKAEPPLRERTVYIPYTKLREVFEKEGRGVFLPYEQFQQLWKAARERSAPIPEAGPPVDILITEVDNEAVVQGDLLRVTARVKVEAMKKGWRRLPLGLKEAALTSAKVGDQTARVTFDNELGHVLLVENPTADTLKIDLALEYVKSFTKAPGRNSASFDAPRAPVSRWKLRFPGPDVKVDIEPLLAASEAPAAAPDAQETVFLAYVGAAPTVSFSWTAKTEGAAGLSALASAQSRQQFRVEAGVIRGVANIDYEISRAELAGLSLELPATERVVNVVDPNVRQWNLSTEGDVQRIDVRLFQPAKGKQSLVIETERYTAEASMVEANLPVIKALDAVRQQGTILVGVEEGLRAETTRRTGLSRLDLSELPPEVAAANWTHAYRYSSPIVDLNLRVEKIEPRVSLDSLVETTLDAGRLTHDVLARFTVERAGVFRFDFDLPAGFEVTHVRGATAGGCVAADVESFHREGENNARLVVNLGAKAMGRVGLSLRLSRPLALPEASAAAAPTTPIELSVPQPAPGSVERSSGRWILYGPESLRMNATSTRGARAVSFADALAEMESTREGGVSRAALAYRYGDESPAIELAAERRKPKITVRQLLTLKVEPGTVRANAQFHYETTFSGARSLRIDLPEAVAKNARLVTPGVSEKSIEPPPADVAPGDVAWSLTGETEFFGQTTIELNWEASIPELEVGKPHTIDVPVLKPRDVERAWGQIAVAKSESIDVHEGEGAQGLEPIDPQKDLQASDGASDAARAFEFHDEWRLALSATRYELEEVKRLSVERAVVRMVVTRGKEISVQANYRMRGAGQRLALVFPEGATFDANPPLLNGAAVSLERGENSSFYVPLAGQKPDVSYVLELRYTMLNSANRLELPVLLGAPAVQQIFLAAYLPEEVACVGADGPWTKEFDWSPKGFLHWTPAPKIEVGKLIQRLRDGVPMESSRSGEFFTEGELLLFSSVRPVDPPDGGLKLVTFPRDQFRLLVIAAVAIVGLLLMPFGAQTKWFIAGFLAVGVALLTVFQPLAAMQVIDAPFFAAAGGVAILWLFRASARRMKTPSTSAKTDLGASFVALTPVTSAPSDKSPTTGEGEADLMISSSPSNDESKTPPPTDDKEGKPS